MKKVSRLITLSNAFRGLVAIALVMSFLALPAPVAADTTTLYPNAAGTYQAWSIFGGAPTHWQATSDLSDSTGVQITGATTSRETENLQDTSQTGTINSVTAYMRARATGGSSQVTYVAAGAGSGTTGNPTPAYPAGLQANDLILLQVTVGNTTTTPTTPTGFNLLYGPDSTTTGRQWIYYRFSNGTETGTITVTIGGTVCKIARMYAFRNVALSSFYEGGSFGSGTGRWIYAEDVTTTDIRRLAVSFVFVNDNNSVGSFTGETGGDWAEAAEFSTGAGSDGTVQLQTATMASAGTISGGSYRMSQADPWGVRAFALIPVTDPLAEQAVILWRTHSTDYESSAQTISQAAFTNYSETRASNPNTGSAWTWAEVNALEVGSRASTLGAGEIIQCSEYWIVVDYTPPVPLPDANFTASPTSGCTTLNVTFTDTSTGNPTTWDWSFPGGNPSTATGQGPHSIIYNSAGSYNVSLTVTNAYGPDTETKPGYITVNQTPTVTISGNPNICGAGNSTTLTADVSGGSSPYIYDWSPSTAPGTDNLDGTFTATGAGTVAVNVTDSLGCTGRAKTTVVVKSPPTVNLSGNLTFCEGGSTTLTANTSGGTPPYTYDWSASTAPGSYVDNTYTATGAGTVAVTVTDSAGCRGVVASDTNTEITQGNVPGATHPYNAVLGWVHPSWWGGLTGYNFGYPDNTAQWIWESYRIVHPVEGDIVYFEHSFNIPGIPTGATIYITCDNGYEVYINNNYLGRAQLGDGWETSDLREPYVLGDGWQSVETWPVAAGLLNSGTNVLWVKGVNEQIDTGTPDGNPGGVIYEVVYEYNAEPNVCGCTATDSVEVTVNPAPTATASSNSPVAEGATIELYGGPDGMSSYSWSGPNGFSSPLQNPTIPNATIAMSGTYTLTVTDANGCQDDASVEVTVTVAPTVGDIEIYATQDCLGPPVTSMDPQTIYYIKVSITSGNNLSYLQTVRVTLFYDSTGGDPTAPTTPDTHTCAILTCTVGTPPSWTIEPNNTPPNPLTTWEIVPGECVQPPLDATSGDWIFAFAPGKVATESTTPADWDAHGLATNNNNQSGELYRRDKAMNWYGEITVPLSVDWGEVPLGLTFEDVTYNPETASIKYIANGDYFEDISSSDIWTGSGETVTLDVTGGNPPPAGMFALMADNTANLGSAIAVTTLYKHINASGIITDEDGVTVNANSLWLSLGETEIAPVTYSGTIYFQVAER